MGPLGSLGQDRTVAPVGGRTRHQGLERERASPTLAAAGHSSWQSAGPRSLLKTAPTGPTVTYAEWILDYVWSVAPEGATNGELARHAKKVSLFERFERAELVPQHATGSNGGR